jgi:hypothetical protein
MTRISNEPNSCHRHHRAGSHSHRVHLTKEEAQFREQMIAAINREQATPALTAAPTSAAALPTPTAFDTTLTRAWRSPAEAIPTAGAYDCPRTRDGATYAPGGLAELTFAIACDVDWAWSKPGVRGGYVRDLEIVIADSIESCVDQCVAWNVEQAEKGTADEQYYCRAVSYDADVQGALAQPGIHGNCFLKNQRAVEGVKAESGHEVSAYLIEETSGREGVVN